MVVVFIIDTGESMGQPCTSGFSCLDMAKCGIELFVKQCISQGKANETFALVDSRSDESCIKCMIGDPFSSFEDAYKGLQPDSDSSLGYAISTAFAMLNQHRVKDGIENFGQGRIPWMLQPATCVLLTDGACFQGNIDFSLSRSSHAFAELVKEPFRWDQRLFTVLIQPKESPAAAEPPASLLQLSEMTGGDVNMCKSMKHLVSVMKAVVTKVQQPRVLLGMSHDINAPLHTKDAMAEMTVKAPGHWPIPEGFWLDRSMDQLPMRSAHPRIVYKPIVENAELMTNVIDAAKKLDFPMDSYDVRWLKAGVHGPPNTAKGQRYTVHVPMSGRNSGFGEAIGIIKGSKIPGFVEMIILPYEFPTLLTLVRQAAETARTAGHMQTIAAALSQQWRQEFNAYLYNVPPYYYAPLRRWLARYGLHTLIPERGEGGLTRGLAKRLQRMQEATVMDLQRIEQARRRGCPPPIDPIIVATRPPELPSNARNIRSEDLLMQWEAMRKAIFGGPGYTVQGLFVKGIQGRGIRCGADPKAETGVNVTLFETSGGHSVARRKIRDMSNYTEVLARMEAPRDPDRPEPDEDTPQGILRRKLTVHFGNPFKTETGSVSDSEAPSSLHIDETAEEVAALFMDTPAPHRDAQLEAEGKESTSELLLAKESNGIGATKQAIPALGKPPTRKRKRPLQGSKIGASNASVSGSELSRGMAMVSPTYTTGDGAASQSRQTQSPVPSAPASPQSVAEPMQLSPRPTQGAVIPVASGGGGGGGGGPPAGTAVPASSVPSVTTPADDSSPPPAQRLRLEQEAAKGSSSIQATPTLPQSSVQAEQEPELPQGWIKHFSKREQQYYYFNTATGTSSWVRPT